MPNAFVNGINIYYEVTGEGPPLVFSHEYAGSHESWDEQVKFFSPRYRVVTYNARGYPPSDVPDDVDAYRQEISIEDLHGLLDHLRIDEAYLCGLSMGGNVVLNFGLTYPSRVKAMVVAGTGTGSTDAEGFRRQLDRMVEFLEADGMKGMAHYTKGPTRVQLKRKEPKAWEEFDKLFSQHSALGAALILKGILWNRPTTQDLKPKLRESKVPTLVMTGDEDVSCIEPAIFMKQNMSKSGLVVFPQTGHTLNLEEPQMFNHTVQSFFNAVDEGRWAEYDLSAIEGFIMNPDSGDVEML